VPLATRCSSLHLGAKSALSRQRTYIDHAQDSHGTVKEETAHQDWAFHADQEYAPNHGSSVLQDRSHVWPANQGELGCDQNALHLLRPMTYLA
jgi:hypothetical protein